MQMTMQTMTMQARCLDRPAGHCMDPTCLQVAWYNSASCSQNVRIRLHSCTPQPDAQPRCRPPFHIAGLGQWAWFFAAGPLLRELRPQTLALVAIYGLVGCTAQALVGGALGAYLQR